MLQIQIPIKKYDKNTETNAAADIYRFAVKDANKDTEIQIQH